MGWISDRPFLASVEQGKCCRSMFPGCVVAVAVGQQPGNQLYDPRQTGYGKECSVRVRGRWRDEEHFKTLLSYLASSRPAYYMTPCQGVEETCHLIFYPSLNICKSIKTNTATPGRTWSGWWENLVEKDTAEPEADFQKLPSDFHTASVPCEQCPQQS